jgi:niacin transporter
MAIAHRAGMQGRNREERLKALSAEYVPAHGVEALGTAGICVAVGVLLPMFVHSIGLSPRAFLPMHFPVFLAGMLLAPQYALLVGLLSPALSAGFTGLPTTSQTMRMMPELATYAVATSYMLKFIPRLPGLSQGLGRIGAMMLAMLVAMLAGRIVYIAMAALMGGFDGFGYYAMVLLTPAIPGIVAQLVVIPPLALRLQRVMTH